MSLGRRGVVYSVWLGNVPLYLPKLHLSTVNKCALVVDCTAMTRATLVRMVFAAAHESSADGAFTAVAWSRVIGHDN